MNSGIKGIKWQKAGSMYINEGEHRIVLRGSNNLLDQIALVPTSAIQNQIALMSHAISHKEIITVLKTGRLIGGKGNWSYEQNRDGTEGFVSMANGLTYLNFHVFTPTSAVYSIDLRGFTTSKLKSRLFVDSNYLENRSVETSSIFSTIFAFRPFLDSGWHDLTLEFSGKSHYLIDTVMLSTGKFPLFLKWSSPRSKEVDTVWRMLSPTEYEIDGKESIGSFLVFSEAYDNGWIATTKGMESRSVPVYGALNSFMISGAVGHISVRYLPQKYVTYGFTVSIITLASCFSYIILPKKYSPSLKHKVFEIFRTTRCLELTKRKRFENSSQQD
jgi:hypothetical protein